MIKFCEAAALWGTLTDEAKARLHADARSSGAAFQGNNYLTKLYIKNDPRLQNYV
jgi:hypothetical protein